MFAIAAAVMCLAVIAARLTGPSDLHDQTQEKTSAYTTDIVLHAGDWERWVLPMQQGMHPATKPPLYNWLAAPAVWISEGRAEWPHRLPSVAAFVGVCGLLWMLGRRIDPSGLTAPLAVIILSSNYAWFKLAGLIRPDTLLSLWLALGWAGVTIILSGAASAPQRRFWRAVIWLACALAVLTKGPPALLIPAFAAVLAWIDGGGRGRWRRAWQGLRECGTIWGLPLVLGITAIWLALVWTIDADHLYHTMIREEFIDRALGTGEEGVKEGPWDLIRTALNMPFYFISRYLPWSLFFFGALYDLRASRVGAGTVDPAIAPASQPPSPKSQARFWMVSGVIFTVLVVLAFTLVAGKRADYIASAYIPASFVVAWCLGHLGWKLARHRPAALLTLAAITLISLVVHDRTNGYAAKYPLSESLWAFAREVRPLIEAEALPLEFYRTGAAPLQTMLHRSQPVVRTPDDLVERIGRHEAAWVIVSDRVAAEVLAEAQKARWGMELRATSRAAQGSEAAEPLEMRLYRVTTARRAPPK